MIEIPLKYRATIDQSATSAAEWVARRPEMVSNFLKVLIEGDDDFIRKAATEDPALIRALVILAIFESINRAERADDPEDVLYLSVDERCELEAQMAALGDVKSAGVTSEQAQRLDAVIGALALVLKI